MSKNNWSLVYDEYLPEQEGLREALCTLGNGYFATRGAFPQEVADDVHYPGTYLAGGYNRLGTEVAGRVIVNEDLVNIPNWLCLTFRINDGEWFQLKAVNVSRFRQELDIKKGLLLRDYTFTDAHGRQTTIKERRFVHMRFSHLAAIELTITADNWSGSMQVRSALDGTVENLGIKRYRELNHRHLIPLEQHAEDDGYIFLKVQTSQSEIRIAQAARTRVMRGHVHVPVSCETVVEEGYVAQNFCIEVSKGETITVEKIITQYTSKDHSCSECGVEALETIKHAPEFDHLLHSHMHAWDYLWDQFKIEIDFNGHDDVRHPVMILRLHLFHLLQTASHHTVDLDVGVPARGWHGEAYRGHIFWDELFIFPTLNFRMPEITQSLLKYRYRRLKQARLLAKEAGYKGAMFPWQSGSDGREESQVVHLNPKSGRWHPDNSSIQRHVSAAIAYNAWRYYEATGNVDFLYTYGAELFLEITRFWASIAEYNKELGRYEIKGVMGPDEYHDAYPDSSEPGLDNNAYTNVMVAWIMCRALEILDILSRSKSEEICHILDITDAEIERWNDMSQRMFVPYHDEVIISQFQGYDKLKEFDWEGYRQRYGDIQRLDRILEAEGDSTNRYKLSKQADVLMLFYLFSVEELKQLFDSLGYPLNREVIEKNIDYYIQRTSHGSTLSRVVHSWVFMRFAREGSWELFKQALESDVADIQGGTTPEGIHLGAMAGTVDIIQRCYTGIETHDNILWFRPQIPEHMISMELTIHYRGHSIDLLVTHDELKLSAQYGIALPVKVGFYDDVRELKAGETVVFKMKNKILN